MLLTFAVAGSSVRFVSSAEAACNLIPGTEQTFDSTLGATTRPFAAASEPIEVRRRPCDLGTTGISLTATDQLAVVVFTPPSGAKHAVVLTAAADCSAVSPLLAACDAQLGTVGGASCVAGATAGVEVVQRNSTNYLRFLFPDTDDLVGTASDDQTLSGPATIAVIPSTAAALPCQLATQTCSGQSGLIACIDDFYSGDGTCGRAVAHGTFNHFTALPPPNDFQAACFAEDPPCDVLSFPDVRFTTDAAGNVLLPMDWRGVLLRDNNVPVPRLLRAILAPPVSVQIPGRSFVASYTPEGGLLPPIFEPQFNPQSPGGVATLFGSVDAPYTILRVARRSALFQRCSGGFNDLGPCNSAEDCSGECTSGMNVGDRCSSDADCTGGSCGPAGSCGTAACVGGGRDLLPCNSDGMCPGGECGPSLFNIASSGSGGGSGPIVLPRLGSGVCQSDTNMTCTVDGECGSPPCVKYALSTQLAVPLDGLAQTQDVFAFTVNEAVEARDRNGDSDSTDSVMTLRDRDTGNTLSIGPGGAQGRAIVRTSEVPFKFPADASEGDVVAFLEPEASQGATTAAQDKNSDGDTFDTILRVYRRDDGSTATEVTAAISPPIAADAALEINHRSLVVSNGTVFFRTPEAAGAGQTTSRVSVSDGEAESDGYSAWPSMTDDGRYIAFGTQASNLSPIVDNNNFCPPGGGEGTGTSNCLDVYVRDRQLATTERVSIGPLGEQGDHYSYLPTISPDGSLVFFESTAENWWGWYAANIVVRDRVAATTSVRQFGFTPVITPDGGILAFTNWQPLLPEDANISFYDIYLHRADTNVLTLETDSFGQVAATDGNSAGPALSRDGRFLAFYSEATNLMSTPTLQSVYLRDLTTHITRPIAAFGEGVGPVQPPAFSHDGRYIAFFGLLPLVPGDTNGVRDVMVYDQRNGTLDLVSVSSTGALGDSDSINPSISGDGRFVAFNSNASTLVPDDTNGKQDIFLHDRLTGLTTRVSVAIDGSQADDASGYGATPLTADGREVAFTSVATNLLGSGNDTNAALDIFVRETNPASLAAYDRTGDGALDDIVLEALDASTAVRTSLCPATGVAVAGGAAAFLRPERSGFTPSLSQCPTGPNIGGLPDLNNDGDANDEVVHFWPGSGNVDNLERAATALAVSGICTGTAQGCVADGDCTGGSCVATWVAALVSESAQGGTILNLDGDAADDVVHVHALGDAPSLWTNIGQAADEFDTAGAMLAFITPETAQNDDLNADNDEDDRILQIYDLPTNSRTNTRQAVEEFVLGSAVGGCGNSPVVAFRTSEAAQGDGPLNGDNDSDDYVLQVYAKGVGVVNTHQAVTACTLAACDPRFPYRVFGSQVKFLTYEPDQGSDLNGDGDSTDLILQVYDVCARTTTVVSSIETAAGSDAVSDPLAQDPQTEGHAVITSGERCVLGVTTLLVPATCQSDADCPNGATCTAELISAAPGVVPRHDSMLLPVKPINVKIPLTKTEVVKTIALKVRNSDVLPVKERAGHVVRLSVGPGTCPPLIADALPDFDKKTAGEQDSVLLSGGKAKAARLLLRVKAADFTSYNGLAPDRCWLRVEASTVDVGNQDPTPSNNVQMVELNVVDEHDNSVATQESALKSVNPSKLTIARNVPVASRTVAVKMVNADVAETSGHAITLAVDAVQSDCPTGSVSVEPPATQTVAGGKSATAKVGITIDRDQVRTGSAKAPARCTAVLTATGPGSDPQPANNSMRLVVEVNDKSDY